MVKTARALLAALLFGLLAGACSDETASRDADDLRSELAELRDQIAEADKATGQQRGGLLGEMAAMRREVLLLSAAMLENRLIASEGGVPEKLVAPARQPDPARAEQLLRHIAATEDALEQAKEAAGGRDGVAGSLSQTAVVTQELTLAQLRLAYFQSAYGLALPGEEMAPGSGSRSGGAGTAAAAEPPRAETNNSDASRDVAGRDVGALIGSVKGGGPQDGESQGGGQGAAAPSSRQQGAQQQAALPPLREVDVPQLPPASYTRRDYTRIQLLLEQAGFDPGPIDGQWGPRTGGALAEFQRAQGLPPNGDLDAATLDALGFY